MLEHGGNLRDAVKNFGRPFHDWLDLSTGINPHYYPVPAVSANAWHRLPEPASELTEAAQDFYQASCMLAVAGTQAAIQALPRLRPACRVAVSAPSYAEHAYQWQLAGHQVSQTTYDQLALAVASADVVVVCNPNNPTGEMILPAQLLEWAHQLAQRGGWLIVDEAFADTTADTSIAAHSQLPGVIVLRSVGKFFGLAGIRLGFVATEPGLLRQLALMLGPWTISGPAQEIALAALRDQAWQQHTRRTLAIQGHRLRSILLRHGISSSGTDLFQWVSHRDMDARTEVFWQFMAQQGIWLRWFAEGLHRPHGIRFGLPGADADWHRLENALDRWSQLESNT